MAETPAAVHALAERFEVPEVKELFLRLAADLDRLHRDVAVRASDIDVRADVAGRPLCRLVPYRELIHVQVGDGPTWESRVREAGGYYQAVDMIAATLLQALSR
jgi:hypothetical protein